MTESDTLPNRPNDALQAQLGQALISAYDLDHEIGRGGMGIVYRARDKRLKRLVAVKLLPPDLAFREEIRSRFLREAETAAQLSHPNIVPIHSVGEADQLVYFVMSYVEGGNLAHQLRTVGTVSPAQTRTLMREVADALAYAHRRGVVHRDIKPDNILLDGESGRAMVTDFGIARAVSNSVDTRLTTTGVAIGTPAYMSPEQAAGDRDADGRSDLYSLGVVAYQMLCGETPFIAPNTPSMLVKHLSQPPRPLHDRCDVPMDLNDAIMRCLAKDPDDRFPNAEAFIEALDDSGQVRQGQRYVPASTIYPGLASPEPSTVSATMRPLARQPMTDVPLSYGASAVGNASQSVPVATHHGANVERWEAEPVRRYRRKLVTFLTVGAGLVAVGLLAHNAPFGKFFLFAAGVWAVRMVASYAKLWDKGYDWRDVFRQSRDRLLVEVVTETIVDTKALFDPSRRAYVLQRMRERQGSPGLLTPASPPAVPIAAPLTVPPRVPRAPLTIEVAASAPQVREATVIRNEIQRMMTQLPPDDRSMLPDVTASADALLGRIQILASSIDELKRVNVPGLAEATEREIVQLEGEANPLDEEGSTRRARRLVQLRQYRASLHDGGNRMTLAEQQMGRCMTAMRSMRTDLTRLRAGSQTYASVTQIADQAIQLGREVDAVLYANDEIARVLSRKS